jgi:peptidoglycan biosynthesis protein MviN/MurJ (putative lipid II flippase)
MGPAVIAASTTQINVLINSMFASTLGDGAIFWLAIAFRLMQLPLGLFGVALGTVTLPLLSRLVVAGEMGAFRSELARALRLMFLLTIPSTIGLMMLAEPIISVIYQHGRFDAYEAAQAGGALRFYAIGLAGYAALKVLVNAFYALDRRKTPMIVSFLAVGLNLLFNWIFTFRLGWGHRGLAFSTGCVATCNFLFLYALDAPASRRSRVAPHARDARQGRCGRSGARGRLRRIAPVALGRLGDAGALWAKTLALTATVVAAGGSLCGVRCGTACRGADRPLGVVSRGGCGASASRIAAAGLRRRRPALHNFSGAPTKLASPAIALTARCADHCGLQGTAEVSECSELQLYCSCWGPTSSLPGKFRRRLS